jgi:hypothetical protein
MKLKLILCSAIAIFVSCSKEVKTIGDYRQAEKKAIEALIAKEGFEVLNSFPANGLFGENQFVLLDNGCYLNIVDSGKGNRAIHDETVVLMRCGLTYMSAKDDVPFSTVVDYSEETVKFVYGSPIVGQTNPGHTILSAGVESALKFVSENAVVRMIVPCFANDDESVNIIGSAYQNINFSPMYYEEIMFEFENR